MSDFINIATIILAGVVQAFLQLNFGALIILYQSSMGKHRRRHTRYLAKSYIWGVASMSFLTICAFCFLINNFLQGELSRILLTTLVGMLVASAFVMLFLYYRKRKSTELWLPKSITSYISKKAKTTNDNVEAFSLGLLSNFAEFPLTIALYAVAANSILQLHSALQIIGIILYSFCTVIPTFALKLQIKSGRNSIEAQRWRVKHLSFIKVVSSCGFGVLALFIIAFWVM